MEKHCKGCIYHVNAGRRRPPAGLAKYNDWCAKRGGIAHIGWCKTHDAKQAADAMLAAKEKP